jgi:hypothetical protein
LEKLAPLILRYDLGWEEARDFSSLDVVNSALSDRRPQSTQRLIDHPNPMNPSPPSNSKH